jgi:luciferase family oxidoreductase group 1
MKTGIIDFGEIDSNPIETIHNTIANAVLAEEKGFSRYWLTEHHVSGVAWRNPELIIALIAASTETIRIGAAGVITAVNQPYRIAQDYKLLSNLFAERIDLGFAKGGMNKEVHQQIIEQFTVPDYFERIDKTKRFLNNEIEHVVLSPEKGCLPPLWVLGSSASSTGFAVKEAMNFSLSLFHNLTVEPPAPGIIANYKEAFFRKNGYEPEVNITVSVFCNDDRKRIEEERLTRKNVTLNVHGNAEECRDKLEKLCRTYEVKEVMILNLGKDHAEKQLLLQQLLETNQILH